MLVDFPAADAPSQVYGALGVVLSSAAAANVVVLNITTANAEAGLRVVEAAARAGAPLLVLLGKVDETFGQLGRDTTRLHELVQRITRELQERIPAFAGDQVTIMPILNLVSSVDALRGAANFNINPDIPDEIALLHDEAVACLEIVDGLEHLGCRPWFRDDVRQWLGECEIAYSTQYEAAFGNRCVPVLFKYTGRTKLLVQCAFY
jgi:hypothetical protein